MKAREVLPRRIIEITHVGEEAGQRARLDGPNRIGEAAVQRERGDVRVAEDFEVRARKLPAERLKHGEGQDKIANRATANDQNFALRAHAAVRYLKTVNPSTATSRPSARCSAQPTFSRASVSVFHAKKSRQRHGATVNQMPATIHT